MHTNATSYRYERTQAMSTITSNRKQNVWDFFVDYVANEPTTEENYEAKRCIHQLVKQRLEDIPEASSEVLDGWDKMRPDVTAEAGRAKD